MTKIDKWQDLQTWEVLEKKEWQWPASGKKEKEYQPHF